MKMSKIALLMRRELSAYFKTPMGYVIAAIVLFINGLLFNYYAIGGLPKYSSKVLSLFWNYSSFTTGVAGILISMRLFAEERQTGTISLLLTSPLTEAEIVLGKFLASFLFFAAISLASAYMPALIFVNGKVSISQILAGYGGLLLLGSLSLSIGILASSLSQSQVVAAVLGSAILSAVWLLNMGAKVAQAPIRGLLLYLSPYQHLQWHEGVISTQDVFYFISGTYLFLLLTTQALKARRWR